ncbi:MAG: helix-turn-helix domain-containing protein [Candidatus Caldarchaeum sp.]|nr:hypothetical protein [Candidatus Caldarchaeum sp.]MDW8062726.1 helix-turn-helix domain-containing protein [Candidatus Caldarchaeum sp.]
MEAGANAVVKALRENFGLNRYQAKAYVSVLKGAAKPKEIARRSGVPVTRVYDVLESLCELGFIQKSGNGYVALDPSHALANFVRQERERIEAAFEEKTKNLKHVLSLLNKVKARVSEEADASILRGLSPVAVKLLEMTNSSDEFVFAVRKAAKLKEQFKKLVEGLVGKKIVFILHPSVEVSEDDSSFFKKIGAEVFYSNAVLLDVLVTKGGEALIGLPLDDEPVVVWVKDVGFSSSLMRSLLELVGS